MNNKYEIEIPNIFNVKNTHRRGRPSRSILHNPHYITNETIKKEGKVSKIIESYI